MSCRVVSSLILFLLVTFSLPPGIRTINNLQEVDAEDDDDDEATTSNTNNDNNNNDTMHSNIRWSGYESKSFRTRENIQRTESVEDKIALVNRAGREQIKSRPIDLDKNYVAPEYAKTRGQRQFLLKVLGDNFLFNAYSPKEMEPLISAMQFEQVAEGTEVIKQGDVGDYYYVVAKGKIEYLLNGASVGFAETGGGFGELALLYDAPRAVSCVAVQATELWKVDQITFRTLMARQQQADNDTIKNLINGIKLFQHLEETDKARFINAMTTVVWKPGDRIVQKGSVGNVFYIVQEGNVRVHDIGTGSSDFEDQTLGPGEFFGERALLTGEKRAANVTAVTEVKTLAMERETFEKAIGPLQMFLDLGMRRRFLQSIPMFAESDLTEHEMDQLARLVDEVNYNKDHRLATQGDPMEMCVWIIRHGSLQVFSGSDEGRTLKSGDYFGDQLIAGDPQSGAPVNAVVKDPLTTWVLQRSKIENVLGDIRRLKAKSAASEKMQVEYNFSELKRMSILGKGAFGTVWLVKYGESAFALKEMSKRQLIDGDQVLGVKREKEMLLSLDHIFILSMLDWYQDDKFIYFLLPIVQGGELFSVVRTQKGRHQGLPNYNSAFYAAGIIEALGYFHQRLIAYRGMYGTRVRIA